MTACIDVVHRLLSKTIASCCPAERALSSLPEQVRSIAYPQAHDFADNDILKPSTAARVLAAFSHATPT
jgi:hypothetical protein